MEANAQTRYVRVTAQKARRVVNLVRGKNAVEAVASLKFQPQAVSEDVRKLIQSAIANARFGAEKAGERFDENELYIKAITVDEGPTMKRIMPRAQGRANRILKRTSHLNVTVATRQGAVKEGAN
ncbi:50S ribosomal protein L22 [Demequina aurantiaca]|uniref:50S ribosomal protein L22 n=1 Tax=Demequina aurantiaca TaxID=676200 RepID=UPI003D34CB31